MDVPNSVKLTPWTLVTFKKLDTSGDNRESKGEKVKVRANMMILCMG